MKKPFKNILLLMVITLFLFTVVFFKYREGVDKSEWITPGDDNKERYYNEHKTSGNPEIDRIQFNHHLKTPVYVDSNIYPTIYGSSPIKQQDTSVPIKQLTSEDWYSKITKPIITPVNRYKKQIITQPTNHKRLIRKRRKKI